jgi:hypothetical protein
MALRRHESSSISNFAATLYKYYWFVEVVIGGEDGGELRSVQ